MSCNKHRTIIQLAEKRRKQVIVEEASKRTMRTESASFITQSVGKVGLVGGVKVKDNCVTFDSREKSRQDNLNFRRSTEVKAGRQLQHWT